jgi:hypothetical protein
LQLCDSSLVNSRSLKGLGTPSSPRRTGESALFILGFCFVLSLDFTCRAVCEHASGGAPANTPPPPPPTHTHTYAHKRTSILPSPLTRTHTRMHSRAHQRISHSRARIRTCTPAHISAHLTLSTPRARIRACTPVHISADLEAAAAKRADRVAKVVDVTQLMHALLALFLESAVAMTAVSAQGEGHSPLLRCSSAHPLLGYYGSLSLHTILARPCHSLLP